MTKVVTANLLRDGAVVYLARGDAWSERLTDAVVAANDADEQRLMAAAAAAVKARVVVAPYAFEVVANEAGPRARSQRELIRARGPSVRPDLSPHPVSGAGPASAKE
jgi:sulfite reductase (NADPH) hemoprotein beta-component